MSAPTKKLTVVVADDDAGLRALLRLMLEQGGYNAEVFENGKLALERLKQGGVDMVVLDVNMPEMDGIETTKRIRTDPVLKKTPPPWFDWLSLRTTESMIKLPSPPGPPMLTPPPA